MKLLATSAIKKTSSPWLGKGSVLLLLLLDILIFALLFVVPAEAADAPQQKIVAEVNKISITDGALNAEVRSYLRKIGHRTLSAFRMAAVEKDALKKLIEEELLYQEGLRLQEDGPTKSKLAVTEAEMKAGVLKIRNRFSSQQTFEASLLKEDLSVDEIRQGIERSLLIQKTWAFFSSLGSEERKERLKKVAESARIQIHPHPVSINKESLAVTGQR